MVEGRASTRSVAGERTSPRVHGAFAYATQLARPTAGRLLTRMSGVVGTVRSANVPGRPRAVAVGFEPTNGLPRYTLSSSANPRSAMVADVRCVLNKPVGGSRRTQPN